MEAWQSGAWGVPFAKINGEIDDGSHAGCCRTYSSSCFRWRQPYGSRSRRIRRRLSHKHSGAAGIDMPTNWLVLLDYSIRRDRLDIEAADGGGSVR